MNWLNQAAREVNQVWNDCNELTAKSATPFYAKPTYWSAFDMNRMLVGCGDVFTRIGRAIAQCVAAEHTARRKQFKTAKLKFRASGGRKKSLGWIPFKVENLRFSEILDPRAEPISPPSIKKSARKKGKHQKHRHASTSKSPQYGPGRYQLTFMGKTLRLFNETYLFDAIRQAKASDGTLKIGQGSFAQDAVGDWYLNVPVETLQADVAALKGPDSSVGIDPGYKSAMTSSNAS